METVQNYIRFQNSQIIPIKGKNANIVVLH